MENKPELLKEKIFALSEKVAEYQATLSAFKAVGPENGGQGELKKAQFLQTLLEDWDFNLERFDVPDKRVECGFRPNLLALKPGKNKYKTLWLFAHMDVVPAGDLTSWRTDPWAVKREGDLLYGRGVEDNQQAICSMLLLANALKAAAIESDYSLGLLFMADEENGSEYGLKGILKDLLPRFRRDDLYIVPDSGSHDGKVIEIAEKGQLWLKFTVLGNQCHASIPQRGKNSLYGSSRLVVELNKLYELFPETNPLFKPPCSTFVPTKHEENVAAINILPGKDVFYLDCRILPGTEPERVINACEKLCAGLAAELDLRIELEVVHKQAPTMINEDSPIIGKLERAIQNVYNVKARLMGIGGATVAAMLREKKLPAVVWSCILNTCHQPNEHSSILATCRDAAVFAELLWD